MKITPSLKRLALLVTMVVPLLVACEEQKSPPDNNKDARPLTSGKLVQEISSQRELGAPTQAAAFDPKSHAIYLATLSSLYEVSDGKIKPIDKAPAPNSQIMLAPGGGIYAWLIPDQKSNGLYIIHLMDIRGKQLSELRLKEEPYGFGALVLGFKGKTIVTITALDDHEGAHGRFQYTFWNRDGRLLEKVILPESAIPIVGADGLSLLLLGPQEATAYSPEGKQLWRLNGQFRKAAIARSGQLALLNPAPRDSIDQVHVFTGSQRPSVVKMPTPVRYLRVTPDGSAAVVCGAGGRYFHFDPASSRFEEGTRLPFKAELFISDIEMVDRDTLAIGVLQQEGKPPGHTWPSGGLVVINRKGDVLFRTEYPVRKPLAYRPGVDVTFGNPTIIGYTLDTTSIVRLGR